MLDMKFEVCLVINWLNSILYSLYKVALAKIVVVEVSRSSLWRKANAGAGSLHSCPMIDDLGPATSVCLQLRSALF